MLGQMNLQIDVGNSFIKWRVIGMGRVVSRGSEATSSDISLCGVDLWGSITSISISSVASEHVDQGLRQLCQDRCPDVKPFFARSEASFRGIINAYSQPSKLGVDRWLAVIAAYSRYKESCFVVDCGSAITIDVVDRNGRHLGGYIVPGVGLMKRSLSAGTKKVEFGVLREVGVGYGCTTSECVHAGVDFVARSIFESLGVRMAQEGIDRLVVTGGDGEYVCSLSSGAEFCPDLVLEGLSLVSGVKCGVDHL